MDGHDAAALAKRLAAIGVVADNRHAAIELARARPGNDVWRKVQKLRVGDPDVPHLLDADAREELLQSKENGSPGVYEYAELPRALEYWKADERVRSQLHIASDQTLQLVEALTALRLP
jgi:hypothetical protein